MHDETIEQVSSNVFLERLYKGGAASVGLTPLIIYGTVNIDRQRIPEPESLGGADPAIETWHRLQNLTFAGRVFVNGIKGTTNLHISRCTFYQTLHFEYNFAGQAVSLKISRSEFKSGLRLWQTYLDRLILIQSTIRGTLDIEGLSLENLAYRQGTTWKKLKCVGRPSKAFVTFQPNPSGPDPSGQTYMELPEIPRQEKLIA